MKTVIYTSITPGYDRQRDDIQNIVYEGVESNPRRIRYPKTCPHKFFEADVSVWVDGNIYLKKGFAPGELLGDFDIALIKHPWRDCIYAERFFAMRRVGRDKECVQAIHRQIKCYRKIGHPERYGLWFGGFIIRRHNERVQKFNEAWWKEIEIFSYRDQLSLPVVIRMFPDLKVKTITASIRENQWFKRIRHLK